jgi:hypothetical protein
VFEKATNILILGGLCTEIPYLLLETNTESPYSPTFMHTVIETPAFQKAAQKAGLSDDDVAWIAETIARNPQAGDAIRGSGGCRKVRVAGRGKGKSGGYRVITFFSGPSIPVYLLTVYSKSDMDNLSRAHVNALKILTKQLIDAHRGTTR